MRAAQHNSLSSQELIEAAARLEPREFERFVSQIIALQAKRQAPNLSHREAELLAHINRGLSRNAQKRFDELVEKRKAETLTSEEHSELLRLIDRNENLQARRITHLGELAKLRQVSLEELMEHLDTKSPKEE